MNRLARLGCTALVLALTGARPAVAELAKAPAPFAIPVDRGTPALGAGYDSTLGSARGEPGACVEDLGTERADGAALSYSLATLSRAGGRLVVGVHVAAVTASESLASPRLTDASRRLAQGDGGAFRELCGDGFVARVELGGHWLAEIEIENADVARASTGLTTGTWSDAEPFRAALESLTKRYRVIARELPGGNRAAARELSPDALIERATGFPESVTSETEQPFLAIFAGYEKVALAGIVLSTPEALDPREVAEQVFRSGRSAPTSTRASRAAEMRLAQVQRWEPELAAPETPRDEEPIVLTQASIREGGASIAAAAPGPAAPAPAERERVASAESAAAVVRKQAALVFEGAGGLPVYATTRPPGGVHSDHLRERFYWVPGMAEPTPDVVRAIESAKTGAPLRGTTVAIVEVGATVVVMTDTAPPAGIFSQPAGEQRAWIAGVAVPDDAQRAALAAAIHAEGAAQGTRQ